MERGAFSPAEFWSGTMRRRVLAQLAEKLTAQLHNAIP
jgi:hypothetical protein